MNLDQIKTVYCLGLGGIGVSSLARLFLAMGKEVSGADLKQSEITDGLEKLGIKVKIGANKVEGNPDLVIYSPAVPAEVIEQIQGAKLSQGQAVGELMKGHFGIGVTGTNGKSTTTAILGLILEAANMDPTVILGSMLSAKNESPKFQANARLGAGKPARTTDVVQSGGYFVAESDEYHRKMLENSPQMIVVTNIAEDHLDYYKNINDIKGAFSEYIQRLPADGTVIYNADDHFAVEVGRQAHGHKFTFGIHHYADLQAINLKVENGRQKFDLHLNDEKIGEFELAVPGSFNVSNALAASLAALKLGVDIEVIKKTLASYAGIWRRFEQVGEISGKPVISDYAHHPAGIEATLAAAKEFFPGKKVLAVFQPHHRNRTKSLFDEFVSSLVMADGLIIPEIFDVAGREHGEDISSKDLVTALAQAGTKASFAENLDEAGKQIQSQLSQFDVILMMGAGDIDSLARRIVQ